MAFSYSDRTVGSRNRLVRMAHRARYDVAVSLLPHGASSVLDFGCGDGHFLALARHALGPAATIIGFEPYMAAQPGISAQILRTWSDVLAYAAAGELFDCVTCFETLEHFSEARQRRALADMAAALRPGGTLIVSVPIEIGAPAVVKNALRVMRYRRANPAVYTIGNVARSFVGAPIPHLREGDAYLSHMGFDYRALARVMAEKFIVTSRRYSPFPRLGPQFNSQVFFTATLR